jgi:hypothetical protein
MTDAPQNHPAVAPPHSELRIAWVGFVKAAALLLMPIPEDRPLDQFFQFRDKVVPM